MPVGAWAAVGPERLGRGVFQLGFDGFYKGA